MASNEGGHEAAIRETHAARDRLVKVLEREGEAGLDGVVAQVRQKERRLKELRGQLAGLRGRDDLPPPPLTWTDVEDFLGDLRGLLSDDMASSSSQLSELIGPVTVEQIPKGDGAVRGEIGPGRRSERGRFSEHFMVTLK